MISENEYPTMDEVFRDALEDIDKDKLAEILTEAYSDSQMLMVSWNLMAPDARYKMTQNLYRTLRSIYCDK